MHYFLYPLIPSLQYIYSVDFKPIQDPGSRGQKGTVSHALSLPPPGIVPGLHASQTGNLPKELSRQLIL